MAYEIKVYLVSIAVAVFCFFTAAAIASPVSLDFRGVAVPELAEGVVKGIMGRDYVLSPGVALAEGRVTLSVKEIDKAKVPALVSEVLRGVGVTMTEKHGVLFIDRAAPAAEAAGSVAAGVPVAGAAATPKTEIPDEIASYRPKYKTLDFLASVAKLAGAVAPETKGGADLLIYGGSAETVAKVRALLEDIDRPTPGYMVKAALVEVTESASANRSIGAVLQLLADKLSLTYQAGAELSNVAKLKTGDLSAALSMIEGDNRFRYVAEPVLRVADGQRARLVVGAEVPTRSGISQDKNGNPIQGIEYRTAGVVISVEPKKRGDDVEIRVNQQVSTFAATTTSNIDSPTLFKRESETVVTAAPGELVMLAGMDESRQSDNRSGLFFLPDLLHSKTKENSRSQLVLLLEVKPERQR